MPDFRRVRRDRTRSLWIDAMRHHWRQLHWQPSPDELHAVLAAPRSISSLNKRFGNLTGLRDEALQGFEDEIARIALTADEYEDLTNHQRRLLAWLMVAHRRPPAKGRSTHDKPASVRTGG